MASLVRELSDRARRALASVIAPPSVSAASSTPYNAASSGRRLAGWFPSNLGPTSTLSLSLDQIRSRARDEVRNNPYAASAVDNFESQVIGNGIFPRWNLANKSRKTKIEAEFEKWATRTSFYAKQATAAREIFEAGEVFVRFHVRSAAVVPRGVPLDIELIESEQVPVNYTKGRVKTGVELDSAHQVVAYHMYKEHPGETFLYQSSLAATDYTRIPASEVLHAFKPLRAGLLRGQPHLSSVLVLLHEIGKYTDAAVVKKQIQTMFAGFITKTDPNADILPIDSSATSSNPTPAVDPPPGVQLSTLETGTIQELGPGEDITFPTLPQDTDIETFLSSVLHQFAAGIGATYEQITGDLRGVNLSSIRAGVLDAHRKVEQFQQNVIVRCLIQPIVRRWLMEAVLSGTLSLPGYAEDPSKYEDISWGMPGWPWLDPAVDIDAANARVRGGFASREQECARVGEDAATIDAQQAADNERAREMGLIYDSNATLSNTKSTKLTKDGEDLTGGAAGPEPVPGAGTGTSTGPTPIKKKLAASN